MTTRIFALFARVLRVLRSAGPALALCVGCAAVPHVAKLVAGGDHRELRRRPATSPPNSPEKAPIVYVALDGVGRNILYELLREGKLPGLATLLGSADGTRFPYAYFDDRMLSTMPSSTMAAWVTTMSGVPPAKHGVTGNEYFIREERTFACPAPVSFSSSSPALQIYTEGYLDSLSSAPTVYERMRDRDPNILIWVALHQVFRGADTLLLAQKTAIASAFGGFVQKTAKKMLTGAESTRVYKDLDEGAMDTVVHELEKGPVPDVLTVYFSGTDLYAHVAEEGPDKACRSYLVEVLDPLFAKLAVALNARGALARRWVVVGADHGHTQVIHDDAHALSTNEGEDPPSVLTRAGFRVRPFSQKVPDEEPFSAVLAYGGALAYVYLADRGTCPGKNDVCNWKAPPRYEEDVLAAAQAFFRNNEDGSIVAPMRAALDMILVRKPKPYAEEDSPFEVYMGGGKTLPVTEWLVHHPHATYIALDARLRELAVGPHGERAGDILLIAHNGDRDKPEDRYYFASPYHSWHGSPSRQDSELPFIVANSSHTTASIGAQVSSILGELPTQQKTTDVLLRLRYGFVQGVACRAGDLCR